MTEENISVPEIEKKALKACDDIFGEDKDKAIACKVGVSEFNKKIMEKMIEGGKNDRR